MASVASGGTADRIAARILFKVLRAGSGRVQGIRPRPSKRRCLSLRSAIAEFAFFICVILLGCSRQVYRSDYHADSADDYSRRGDVSRLSAEIANKVMTEGLKSPLDAPVVLVRFGVKYLKTA